MPFSFRVFRVPPVLRMRQSISARALAKGSRPLLSDTLMRAVFFWGLVTKILSGQELVGFQVFAARVRHHFRRKLGAGIGLAPVEGLQVVAHVLLVEAV